MVSNYEYYTTTIIENHNVLDELGEGLIFPIRGILRLFTGKKVRVFKVKSSISSDTREVASKKWPKTTLEKVIFVAKVIFYIISSILLIPLVILGLTFKVLAQCTPNAKRKNKLLKNFLSEEKAKKIKENIRAAELEKLSSEIKLLKNSVQQLSDKSLLLSQISNEIFFYHVLPYLSLEDIKTLKQINKIFYKFMHFPHQGANVYRQMFKGLAPLSVVKEFSDEKTSKKKKSEEEKCSFDSIVWDCKWQAKLWNYSGLIKIFGSLDNFLRIPIYPASVFLPSQKKINPSNIDQIAQSENFKKMPSVMRIRCNWLPDGGVQEIIVIKYTLFGPQEGSNQTDTQIYTGIERPKDKVWHDYFIIAPRIDDHTGLTHWSITDKRTRNLGCSTWWEDATSRPSYDQFPYHYPPMFNELSIDRNESTSFHALHEFLLNNKALKLGLTSSTTDNSIFDYIKAEKQEYSSLSKPNRLFADLPLVLGYKELDDIYALFKIKAFDEKKIPEWNKKQFLQEFITFDGFEIQK